MSEKKELNDSKNSSPFSVNVRVRVRHKLNALRNSKQGVWFGLGMMGLIGWAVVVPTLLGAAIGIWLDNHYANQHSWTLSLLVAGLILGCFNAWHWVAKEEKEMMEDQQNGNDK